MAENGTDSDAIQMTDIRPMMRKSKSVEVDEEGQNPARANSNNRISKFVGSITRHHQSHRSTTMRGQSTVLMEETETARITNPRDLKDSKKMASIRRAVSVVIDDEENRMKKMPSELANFEEMTELTVRMSKIKSIPALLSSNSNITALHLNETSLSNMDGVCLMVQLKEIELSGNKIVTIPRNIQNLKKLEILDLSGNHINAVPVELGGLTALKKLLVTSNKITALPESLCKLANLEVLDVSRNKIHTLPTDLGDLMHLQELSASHNQISSFPESIVRLRNLTHLAMTRNCITTIPAFFEQLTSLKHISLAQNMIKSILGIPPSIESIVLDKNQLEEIDGLEEFSGASTLHVLSLRYNSLQRLPETIDKFVHLHALYLDGNKLKGLPDSLKQLTELKHLSLGNTQIRQLPREMARSRLSVLVMDTEELPSAIEYNDTD